MRPPGHELNTPVLDKSDSSTEESIFDLVRNKRARLLSSIDEWLLWLEPRTPDRKAWVRCPMPPNTLRYGGYLEYARYGVHSEHVLVKSVGLKVLWAESRVKGTREYFPPL
ncbi:hypothetical protein TNCV_2565781 [Trichonephila clavipes]|nr:hypothetical protein TNCV_2565781 [Trichonephila clavipes]